MRHVVFAAPFPLEATMRFARAASHLPGVKLTGLFQEAPTDDDRRVFQDVVVVKQAMVAQELADGVDALRQRHGHPHRIVGVLEPLQVQLAEVRAHFQVPGTDPVTADLFRDKAKMKDRLRAAGLPVARHKLVTARADAEAFAREVGFPMVLKPPAGMGARATFRVSNLGELLEACAGMHVSAADPVLAEEMIVGREGSFDTITIGGVPQLGSISYYLPTPLTVLENAWIQWCCLLPRENGHPRREGGRATPVDRSRIDEPELAEVKRVGIAAIEVLGLRDGFTHMEWFQRSDGSVAIGEIAQRPPGANITRMIGVAYEIDPYRAWARAVIDGAFDGPYQRKQSVGCAFLRGAGDGRITAVTGVGDTNEAIKSWVVEAKLPTVGAMKSDSYEGDGYVIVRDPHTATVEKILKHVIETVKVHYA